MWINLSPLSPHWLILQIVGINCLVTYRIDILTVQQCEVIGDIDAWARGAGQWGYIAEQLPDICYDRV
jgi:hypothetical protein